MDFRTLREAQPTLLIRAGKAWDTLAQDFQDRVTDFKTKVVSPLQEGYIWRGKASDAAQAHNSLIEAGGTLASWAMAGVSYSAGGVGGAVGGTVGVDVINEIADSLKQDSSNIVTDKVTDMYELHSGSAQRLLDQVLWEHRMWDDGDAPPIDWERGESDQARNLHDLNGEERRMYESWLAGRPYSNPQSVGINHAAVDGRYADGISTYENATGKTEVDYGDTKAK